MRAYQEEDASWLRYGLLLKVFCFERKALRQFEDQARSVLRLPGQVREIEGCGGCENEGPGCCKTPIAVHRAEVSGCAMMPGVSVGLRSA